MTDIEQKALALVNEIFAEMGGSPIDYASLIGAGDIVTLALCRALEQHEAFRQEVSDAVEKALGDGVHSSIQDPLLPFIIPADPLVAMAEGMGYYGNDAEDLAEEIRAELDALGFEIRERGK